MGIEVNYIIPNRFTHGYGISAKILDDIYDGLIITVDNGISAFEAAEICAINILAQLKAKLGTLDKIEQIIKVEGYVASVPEFTEHSKVINGASDLFLKIFGEKGKHTRIAVGMASLPLNAPVEISLVAKIKRE